MGMEKRYWLQVRFSFRYVMRRSSVVEESGNCAVTVSLDSCVGFDTEVGLA